MLREIKKFSGIRRLMMNARPLLNIQTRNFISCVLKSRAVLRVEGSDTRQFLQGMLSNDIFHLSHDVSHPRLLYSGLFSPLGRVECDLFVHYLGENNDRIFIDCCRNYFPSLLATFKKYKLRSKVSFHDVTDEYKVIALIPRSMISGEHIYSKSHIQELKSMFVPYFDPRSDKFGYRVLNSEGDICCPSIDYSTFYNSDNEIPYKELRCKLGVCENSDEIPPNKAIPLEYNFDYFNAVNFEKGCYIGQELTTRTKFCGVVRKRIVPIRFSEPIPSDVNLIGENIIDQKGVKVGEVRATLGYGGIALVRLENYERKDLYRFHLEKFRPIDVSLCRPFWMKE